MFTFAAFSLYVVYVRPHRWPEIANQRDRKGRPPFEVLIQNFPEAAKIVMDRSVQPSTSVNITDPDYSVRYDFHLLDPGPDDPSSVKGRSFFAPAAMVEHGREQLLQHPLTTKLLEEKWSTFGRIPYYVNFFTYILFVFSYSTFMILARNFESFFDLGKWEESLTDDDAKLDGTRRALYEVVPIVYYVVPPAVQVIGFVHFLKKILQLCIKPFKHVADIANLFEWALYGTTVSFTIGIYGGKTAWRVGIVSIFLCYVNLVLFLRRFHALGIYVIMYVEVTKTMLKVLLVFSVFIFGFGIVFFVLFNGQVRTTLKCEHQVITPPPLLFSWTRAR